MGVNLSHKLSRDYAAFFLLTRVLKTINNQFRQNRGTESLDLETISTKNEKDKSEKAICYLVKFLQGFPFVSKVDVYG
jgi:intergrase/recombinase